jgi:ribosomal protein L16 Arg81 hydroxylase
MTAVITVSGYEGAWRVVEEAEDRLVLTRVPERTVEQMRAELGSRAMTPEEFEQHFGHLPSDPEG